MATAAGLRPRREIGRRTADAAQLEPNGQRSQLMVQRVPLIRLGLNC